MKSRMDVINKLVNIHGYKTYLEIGCEGDQCFSQIDVPNKIGVDPVSGGTHRMTSDGFFASTEEKFDIIFVDGLHHSDQVKRDIENGIQHLNTGGSIVVHDINPKEKHLQFVPRSQSVWTGDCWKAWVDLRRTRSSLRMMVLDLDTGIGIIKSGNQKCLETALEITYENFDANRREWLNIVDEEQFGYLIDPVVLSYYQPIVGFPEGIEIEIIEFWKESWERRGWKTKMINREMAEGNRSYGQFVDSVSRLPTVNRREYMLSCFTRWMAFLEAGGGFAADYDCINYSYQPPTDTVFSKFTTYDGVVPSFVSSGITGVKTLVDLYIDGPNHFNEFVHNPDMMINGKLEVSDMTVISFYKDKFNLNYCVKSTDQYGWQNAPLLHFHHGVAPQNGRVNTIKSARKI